jgi:saccharopine dehydrogenase-like NADP-dependent oxidoreductase
MKRIVILGAGRSATDLIHYLAQKAVENQWEIIVCDADLSLAEAKIKSYANSKAVALNLKSEHDLNTWVKSAELVISLLPPHLHLTVAQVCLQYKTNLLTASYVDDALRALNREALESDILILGEMGLDPGIDHMSSMDMFDRIHKEGGIIKKYYSSTGGLVAPSSDDNPWHYKFSWNPKNVVLAGKGTAQFIEDGQIIYVPYHRIFKTLKSYTFQGFGEYESYPNRNSISYKTLYKLHDIETLYRGTLRKKNFAKAWHSLIDLGYTNDSFIISSLQEISYRELTKRLAGTTKDRFEQVIWEFCQKDAEILEMLQWLGILDEMPVPKNAGTPADVLEELLLRKWNMNPEDKDLVIMHHEVEYTANGQNLKIESTLKLEGDNAVDTAMSKCVGLPLALYAEHLLLRGKPFAGVHIPVDREIYSPVLEGLRQLGIHFEEKTYVIS